MLVFGERGKPEYPEKNLSEQGREPTNLANMRHWIGESNPGHIGGRRVLSPLRHPCSHQSRHSPAALGERLLLPRFDVIRTRTAKYIYLSYNGL